MTKDLRSRCTGEAFGLYWKVTAKRPDGVHEIYLYADRVDVLNGNLCFFKKGDPEKGDPPQILYRSFASGSWTEFAAASCIDGSEMWEEHDYALGHGGARRPQ